jgi:rhodanese-related sulfurtransferase/glyoxylase-like metal-dependent hydrolase (beta-lactamase superfamily II)
MRLCKRSWNFLTVGFTGLLAILLSNGLNSGAFAQQATAQQNGVVTGEVLLAAANTKIRNIDRTALEKLLSENPDAALVDVRTRREVSLSGGTIGVYQNQVIPRGWLEFRIGDTVKSKDTPIIVYCGTNQRSPLAAQTLTKLGYTNVWNYPGGFFEWRKAGLPVERDDKALDTALYSKPVKVTDNVWSAIGATAPGTYENGGHNNNLSFIITTDGVVVVNAGDNYQLASALHDEIRKITKQPVKYVVLENGQGHAALGSSYWKEQGAKIIAHKDAAHELKERGLEILDRMKKRMREKAAKTKLVMPDITFEKKHVIELGGTRIELRNLGSAHSPGDIVTWLPQTNLVISGDIAFHQRLLPIFKHTDTKAWLESWRYFEGLIPSIVIPGHGEPTRMGEVRKYTKDYLVYLRSKIGKLIKDGGGLKEAYLIDQSPYQHLPTFRQLAKRNAGQVFRAMEFK